MFDTELEWTVRGGGRKRHHPFPLLPFDLRLPPLVKFFFSPQPFAAVKIRDDSYNSADYDETTVTTDFEHFKIGS